MTAVPNIPRTVTFETPRGFQICGALFAALIIGLPSFVIWADDSPPGLKAFFLAFLAPLCIYALWGVWHHDIVTVDEGARRIRFQRSNFGRSYKTIFDVAFNECESAGLVRFYREGMQPCVSFKNGSLYRIPYPAQIFLPQARREEVLLRFLAATSLPRVDRP